MIRSGDERWDESRLPIAVVYWMVIILVISMLLIAGANEASAQQFAGCPESFYSTAETENRELLPSQLYFIGDFVDVTEDEISLRGSATLLHKGYTIRADNITYDRHQNQLEAGGNVLIEEAGIQIETAAVSIDLNQDSVIVQIAEFRLLAPKLPGTEYRTLQSRGEAKIIELEDRKLRLGEAAFTFCPENNNDAVLVSSEIELDAETGQGTARDATLRVRDVPVFYFPYIKFPIGEQRRSGFLFPKVGYETRHGTVLEIPYYFNLAPNYDATVSTNLLSKRGVQLQTEYRYLSQHSETKFRGEYLQRDSEHSDREPRYAAHVDSKWHNDSQLSSRLDVSWVSDKNYVEDFSGLFPDREDRYLQQNVEVTIADTRYKASIGVNRYIILNPGVVEAERRTHDRIPWASYEQVFHLGKNANLTTTLGMDKFRHKTEPSGTRTRTDTAVEFWQQREFGKLNVTLGGETLHYRMSDVSADSPGKASVTSSYYIVDGKLYFDRNLDDSLVQSRWTLEPRIQILSASNTDQGNLPNFDTTIATIDNYEDLFRSSPYIGGDRVRDVQKISVGISASLYKPLNPVSVNKIGLGQIFYQNDRGPRLDNSAGTETQKSDLFFGWQIKKPAWEVSSGILYDDRASQVNQAVLKHSMALTERSKLRSVYRFLRDEDEQFGSSLSMKLQSDWSMKLQHIESLKHNQQFESLLQFDYLSCCWNAGVRLKRETERNGKKDDSIHLYIQIKGFG